MKHKTYKKDGSSVKQVLMFHPRVASGMRIVMFLSGRVAFSLDQFEEGFTENHSNLVVMGF